MAIIASVIQTAKANCINSLLISRVSWNERRSGAQSASATQRNKPGHKRGLNVLERELVAGAIVSIRRHISSLQKEGCLPQNSHPHWFSFLGTHHRMRYTQHTTRRHCPCSSLQCGTMQRGGVGPSRFTTWDLGPRHASEREAHQGGPAAERLISFWSGEPIAWGDRRYGCRCLDGGRGSGDDPVAIRTWPCWSLRRLSVPEPSSPPAAPGRATA